VGLENEAPHLQYQWADGEPHPNGGLIHRQKHVLSAQDIPNLFSDGLLKRSRTRLTPGGSIADDYEKGRTVGSI